MADSSSRRPAEAAWTERRAYATDASLVVRVRLPSEATTLKRDELTETVASKRARPSRGSDDSDGTTNDSADEAPRLKRSRKPTYAVRKAEKEVLLQEMRVLEARVEILRKAVGMPSLVEDRSLEKSESENRSMEEARQSQLLALCGGHAVLSQYLRGQFSSPLRLPIHLGKDLTERRSTLLSLRRKKLDIAYKFLEARLHGVDERHPFADDQSWVSADGDYCAYRADIHQFEGLESIKTVFDAIIYYSTNMEISVSEHLGQLTLREDIDCVDTRISNHRIVSSTNHGVEMEINSVCFAEHYESFEKNGGEPYALMTNDSVDTDELYPYCPESRVQKCIKAAMSLSSYRQAPKPGQTEGDMVVVLRRCAYLCIKKPSFAVSPAALAEVVGTIEAWGNLMTKTIYGSVYAIRSCETIVL